MEAKVNQFVKLIHARDLKHWDRFPAYEEHDGKTLAKHLADINARQNLGSKIKRLVQDKSLVDCANNPKIYLTKTVLSPWPISLPGRQSVPLSLPDHPETTFDSDIGQVKRGRLVLPLFMKQRRVQVHYLAPDRITIADLVAKAETRLINTPEADLETLRNYLTTSEPDQVLFVSHRWKSLTHPDPDGRDLEKLKVLKDCYLIYDYTSFPQETATPEAERALHQVLDSMSQFVNNVLVLSDSGYMSRGWCLYEYIISSLKHRIVCDELNDPTMVRLRNLVATDPNPPGIGSTYREARNGKNQLILETVNSILPSLSRAGFTVPADRTIVEDLLVKELRNSLPRKQEYIPYVGEWKTIEWTAEELKAAFSGELKWEALQYDATIPIFKPKVPDTLIGAVTAGFRIEKQPKEFGQEHYNFDLSGLRFLVPVIQICGVVLIILILWALYSFVRWIFEI